MTDDYTRLEEEIMTELRNLSSYFKSDWQVGRDDAILNRGADYLAVAKSSGGSTPTNWSSVDINDTLSFPIELYTRYYKNIDETKKRMNELREEVKKTANSYSFLRKSVGVMESSLSVNDLQYVYIEDDSPSPVFVLQVVTINVSVMTERAG